VALGSFRSHLVPGPASRPPGGDPRQLGSLAADPNRPGRVLAATGSGSRPWNAGSGEYATQVFEHPAQDASWRPSALLRSEAHATVQLRGFTADGTLYAQVDQQLVVVGPQSLLDQLRGRT
jgi:hypothetical protein